MRFTFDEAGQEKSVNVFDIDGSGVHDLKIVPLTSCKKLVRLQANSAADGVALLEANKEALAELTLNPFISALAPPKQRAALVRKLIFAKNVGGI